MAFLKNTGHEIDMKNLDDLNSRMWLFLSVSDKKSKMIVLKTINKIFKAEDQCIIDEKDVRYSLRNIFLQMWLLLWKEELIRVSGHKVKFNIIGYYFVTIWSFLWYIYGVYCLIYFQHLHNIYIRTLVFPFGISV